MDIIQELLPEIKAYIGVYVFIQMIGVVFAIPFFIKLLKEF
jgi:hypothetical protein